MQLSCSQAKFSYSQNGHFGGNFMIGIVLFGMPLNRHYLFKDLSKYILELEISHRLCFGTFGVTSNKAPFD